MVKEKIWLFTDGGAFDKGEYNFRAVSSFRMFKDDKELIHKDVRITEVGTSPYAEIQAICDGLTSAHDYIQEVDRTNIIVTLFTDSMLCHQSLTKWIFGWMKKAKDGVLYNSKGEEVANQKEIKYAFNKMLQIRKMDCQVMLFHVNSHTSKKGLRKLHQKFEKFNNIKIPYEDFEFVYVQNEECDKMIKEAHAEYVTNKKENDE